MKLIDYVGGLCSPSSAQPQPSAFPGSKSSAQPQPFRFPISSSAQPQPFGLPSPSSAQPQPSAFPGSLELPDELIKAGHDIYEKGERMGREVGQSLKLVGRTIKFSGLIIGNANSTPTIPVGPDPSDFGDMHCHPSFSIGHVNGYCPHSFEDWWVFGDHVNKPVFIRFVVSGPYFYAVVHRNGVSQYSDGAIATARTEHLREEGDYIERFHPKLKGVSMEDASGEDDPAELAKEQLKKKRQAPGFGEAMMKLAGVDNVALANRLKFGFYVGDRNKDKFLLKLTDKWSVDPNEHWNNHIYAVAMSRGLL
jgi:hypothetical protein